MPTILIIDDDARIVSLVMEMLERQPALAPLQIEVVTASGGSDGLAKFEAVKPSVVITDLLMPKVDGFALCKQIRSHPDGKSTVLVAMSGLFKDSKVTSELRTNLGVTFFSKPYQLKQMIEFVTRCLSEGASEAPTPEAPPAKSPATVAPATGATASGSLVVRPLSAVLLDLLDSDTSGRLIVSRGPVKKQIEIYLGHPQAVHSNVRSETLGPFLVARRVIDHRQHLQAVQRAAQEDRKIGETLIEMGLLSPSGLIEALTEQIRYKLVQTLRWPEGTWLLTPSEGLPVRAQENALDMLEVVLTGLRDTCLLNPPPPRLTRLRNAELALSSRGRRLLEVVGRLVSSRFAREFSDGSTIDALLQRGIHPRDLWRSLDALQECGGLVATSLPADEQPAEPVPGTEPIPANVDPEVDVDLYSLLFDDFSANTTYSGKLPLALTGAGGPFDTDEEDAPAPGTTPGWAPSGATPPPAEQSLTREYLRIQGASCYEILQIDRGANATEIEAAIARLRARYPIEQDVPAELGQGAARIEALHQAYIGAGSILLDPARRRSYDRDLDGEHANTGLAPPMAAEASFRDAEELLEAGNHRAASALLSTVVDLCPGESAYRAALGWALFLAGGADETAAETAVPHLSQALATNPDDAAANEYMGRIAVAVGDEDQVALSYLERALDIEPTRTGALGAVEDLRRKRGELTQLAGRYRLLARALAPTAPSHSVAMWLALARLQHHELADVEGARSALTEASKLAPDHAEVLAALYALDEGSVATSVPSRAQLLRRIQTEPDPRAAIVQLFSAATATHQVDLAFVCAAALVHLHGEENAAEQFYTRNQPRLLSPPDRALTDEDLALIRHERDFAALGRIFAVTGPVIDRLEPLAVAESEVSEGSAVDASGLPPDFAHVSQQVARVLAVTSPPVYCRTDFGAEIHVGAVAPLVLLAGDRALQCTDRIELAFRLGRALSFVLPGRAVGAARPASFLRQVVLAVYWALNPDAPLDDRDGALSRLRTALAAETTIAELADPMATLTAGDATLNLSQWRTSLARTADRVGLLLCGDPARAATWAEETGGHDAGTELILFSLSAPYLQARRRLGLSVQA